MKADETGIVSFYAPVSERRNRLAVSQYSLPVFGEEDDTEDVRGLWRPFSGCMLVEDYDDQVWPPR